MSTTSGIHGKSLGVSPRLPATKIAASPKKIAAKNQPAPRVVDFSTTERGSYMTERIAHDSVVGGAVLFAFRA
jgi:hypothetical protein